MHFMDKLLPLVSPYVADALSQTTYSMLDSNNDRGFAFHVNAWDCMRATLLHTLCPHLCQQRCVPQAVRRASSPQLVLRHGTIVGGKGQRSFSS